VSHGAVALRYATVLAALGEIRLKLVEVYAAAVWACLGDGMLKKAAR